MNDDIKSNKNNIYSQKEIKSNYNNNKNKINKKMLLENKQIYHKIKQNQLNIIWIMIIIVF